MQFPGFKNTLDKTSDSKSGGPKLFVKTGFEYFIDPTQSLGVSATLSDGIRNNENKTYTLDNGPGDKKYWRYTKGW
ncbi:MAG: hypothetical protein Ct9H300mP18_04950 [Candidatus Neomarinimicrobiota bacterium]|nr:MAG: hypothetical protein Ct9H300mP18_04950 [Candidatus Neomarinimicrobiota bacterium]